MVDEESEGEERDGTKSQVAKVNRDGAKSSQAREEVVGEKPNLGQTNQVFTSKGQAQDLAGVNLN